ncbi:hypothetical protein V499_08424 [Pseudogymnoascus sp. VKM F-103]|uniref:Endoplasmic reticulum transmembrane protein n=1 Tax=Pseudogymnoascus verrucosus TaxID=342668 RepID=A0A2P2SWW2_9PEZI|nr:uncharacterized protein VE01_00137 [Pseudogymnoascus verrucosus]KFY71373.1 hypothetical protein V499_08424 [Pseudogymnoascus sp. VKM F-103]OBU01347.1 hypothetical protein VE01_00137 [Pseudogymnoascus verrucosus]
MTLYYSLVFMLLVAEMGLFVLLIVPLPFNWRLKLYTFISESPVIAKIQYGLKITFIFILILFLDSVNRVYRVQVELALASEQSQTGAVLGHERMEVQARKFYSQRNMYLCGFTLFLSLILNRTYLMIMETLRLETKLKQYQGDAKASGKDAQKLEEAGGINEIGNLKRKLAQKDQDLENLKKQCAGLTREYNELSDKYAATQSTETLPKKDR